MLGPFLCVLLIAFAAALAFSGATNAERKVIAAGLVAHLIGSVALVLYHYRIYHGGDMYAYNTFGRELAHVVERDSRYFPDVLKLAFHFDNDLPSDEYGLNGSSSGTMVAFTALLMMVLGDDIYMANLVVAAFAFLGWVQVYRAMAPRLDPVERRALLFATMVVPSVVFWTSGIIKEAFVVAFLGLTLRGLAAAAERRLALAIPLLLVGVVGTALVKPYILFAVVLGAAAWIYATRRGKLAAGYKLLAVVVAVGGLFAVTQIFPDYGAGLAESVARQQVNYDVANGSDIALGENSAKTEDNPTLLGQVRYIPLALLSALARPLPFEARNLSSLIAAVEMTALLVYAFGLRRMGWRRLVREVSSRPPLVFCAVFVLALALGVGLTTRNVGTLSRYRAPMLPFYVGLVAMLRARSMRKQLPRVVAPKRPPVAPPRRRAA